MRSIHRRIPGVSLILTTRSLMAQGNGIAALWCYALSLANSKRPVRLTVRSRSLLIRPNTPDLLVAETCFDGEFAAAISAATPLYHNFIIDAGGYIGTARPRAEAAKRRPGQAGKSVRGGSAERYTAAVGVGQIVKQ